jgi:hypothetical protein
MARRQIPTNPEGTTGKDRRRSQNRLAQRAYRERKESAVESLRKRIMELEKLNETMGREYTTITDIILNQNSVQGFPDIAQQIKDSTTKLLDMARDAEQHDRDDGLIMSSITEEVPGLLYSTGSSSQSSGQMSRSCPSPEITHLDLSLGLANVPDQVPVPGWPSTSQADFYTDQPMQAGGPTLATTSFYPGLDFFNAPLPGVSHASTLQPPRSYAATELTFGRRLHRASQESGSLLASMQNPPPLLYMKTFGFCLHFETRQEIAKRMKVAATQARDKTLNDWRYPFTNLGGAGLFYPELNAYGADGTDSSTGLPIGNRSLSEAFKPADLTGLSMGPFSAEVEAVRDLRLNSEFRILEPAFQGDFFDSDEIEICLRSYGVTIPPSKDFVTAHIDMSIFEPHKEQVAALSEHGLSTFPEGPDGRVDLTQGQQISTMSELTSSLRNTASSKSASPPAYDSTGRASRKSKVVIDVESLITCEKNNSVFSKYLLIWKQH